MPPKPRTRSDKGAGRSGAAQSPPIVQTMVLDALRSWVIPAIAGTVAAVFWFLDVAGMVPEAGAVTAIGAGLFVLVVFNSCQKYFFAEEAHVRLAATAFAAIWTVFILASFWRHNFPGQPLAAGVLQPGGSPLEIPEAGRYALVVDGGFKTAEAQGNRIGQYHLELAAEGTPPESIVGSFEDQWSRQRLGRRGSAPVEVQHTSVEHFVTPLKREPHRLRVVEMDSTLKPELAIAVYAGVAPWIFPALGTLAVLAVLAWEKRIGGEGAALMTACVTLFVTDTHLRWVPHAALRPFIGAMLIGGILGAPVAALLWRFVPRRWFTA